MSKKAAFASFLCIAGAMVAGYFFIDTLYQLDRDTFLYLNRLTLLALAVPDLLGMPYLYRRNYKINYYGYFHSFYGIKRTTIVKLLGLGFLFVVTFLKGWSHFRHTYVFYIVYLIVVASSYAKGLWPQWFKGIFSGQGTRNNLDSLAGLLVYPFNTLRADVSLYDHRSQPLGWSWKAFLLPEAWFFNREIVGAGCATLLMLALCFLLYSVADPGSGLALFILVRVASGLYAHKLYYARYGKLP
jgi:hypothetical protein